MKTKALIKYCTKDVKTIGIEQQQMQFFFFFFFLQNFTAKFYYSSKFH